VLKPREAQQESPSATNAIHHPDLHMRGREKKKQIEREKGIKEKIQSSSDAKTLREVRRLRHHEIAAD